MDETRSIKLHPKQKLLVSTSRDGSVRLWDCGREGRPKLTNNLVFHTEKVTEALFMEDWIVTGSWDQNIGLWKMSEFLEK
jgi:WD40 repeat protein